MSYITNFFYTVFRSILVDIVQYMYVSPLCMQYRFLIGFGISLKAIDRKKCIY